MAQRRAQERVRPAAIRQAVSIFSRKRGEDVGRVMRQYHGSAALVPLAVHLSKNEYTLADAWNAEKPAALKGYQKWLNEYDGSSRTPQVGAALKALIHAAVSGDRNAVRTIAGHVRREMGAGGIAGHGQALSEQHPALLAAMFAVERKPELFVRAVGYVRDIHAVVVAPKRFDKGNIIQKMHYKLHYKPSHVHNPKR